MSRLCLLAIVVLLGLATLSNASTLWTKEEGEKQLMYAFSSYCDRDSIMNWRCYWCKGDATDSKAISYLYDSWTQTVGFIAVNPKHNQTIVSFRGSASIVNWIQNLKFFKDPYKNVKNAYVHKGFFQSYNSIKTSLYAGVKQALKECENCRNVVFTGHSLGAAVAGLAALDLVETNAFPGTRISALHFGGPRLGNPTFAEYYKSKVHIIRATHGADIVVHLPPRLLDYSHSVQEVWENKGSYKQCSKDLGEDSTCANSKLGISTTDHLIYMGHRKISGC